MYNLEMFISKVNLSNTTMINQIIKTILIEQP